MSNSAPRTLGDYELLEELGRGGIGVVFRARHPVVPAGGEAARVAPAPWEWVMLDRGRAARLSRKALEAYDEDPARAIDALGASISKDPGVTFPLAWIERGRLRMRTLLQKLKQDGDRYRRPDPNGVRDAIRDLNVGLRTLPRHGSALQNRARLKLMLGDRDGARADFEAALAAQPPLSPTVQAKLRRAVAQLR